MTPYEAWSWMKPSVDNFRVWGCLAHVHVLKIGRSKLDDRSSICIFLGVSEGTKGYRLMDTNAKRIVISRDVVFEEDKCWKWGVDYKEQVTTDLEWEDDRIDVEIGGEHEQLNARNAEEPANPMSSSSSQSTTFFSEDVDSYQGRVGSTRRTHRAPNWLNDYVTGEGLSEEDEVHMVLDAEADDPAVDSQGTNPYFDNNKLHLSTNLVSK
ncbi:hypothetical protein LIER_31000 [Lithospermum erythrorhizon]|uniref:Retroviral polymerase SH3-like domain-containing protein n=1 Tax=Lithospermum erythrorhizon TaxID=34254 RepID=A0AAV3RQK6_LITER